MSNSTMQPKPGDRVAAYVRVSMLEQWRQGNMEGQDQQIARNLASLDPGPVTVATWYVDPGRKRDRWEDGPDFQRLLADVRAGKWDWIVIDTSERMGSKHSFEKDSFINTLLDFNTHLWSVQAGWMSNPDDFGQIIVGHVNDFQSREEIKKKSRWTMRGKAAAAERGEYCGGAIPYGYAVEIFRPGQGTRFTVAVKESALGEPVTLPNGRAVRQRQTVYLVRRPDGTVDEQPAFPAYDDCDRTRFVLTWEEERLDLVRWLFTTFTSTDTTTYALARTLNRRGVRPTYGVRWEETHVSKLLSNPIYKGLRVHRRETYSAYHDCIKGEVTAKTFRGNRKLPRRRTKPEEQISHEVTGLVDEPCWDAAQVKLEARKTNQPKPGRHADLWMRPFVYCSHCGKNMHGRRYEKGERTRPNQFVCPTWKQSLKGDSSATGCKANAVDASLLERVVNRYLEEAGLELDRLIVEESPGVIPLAGEVVKLEEQTYEALGEMLPPLIGEGLVSGVVQPLFDVLSNPDVALPRLIRTWRDFFADQRTKLVNAIGELERDLETMTENFLALKGQAQRQRAQAIIDRKQTEVDALKVRLNDCADRLEGLWSDLAKRRAELADARAACQAEDKRRFAECLRKVVARVEVNFTGLDDPEGIRTHNMGRPPAYLLLAVRVVPVTGAPQTYAAADLSTITAPCPRPCEEGQVDLLARLCTRQYSGADLRKLVEAA